MERMEHDRMEDVPPPKRPAYIWCYYKWHIIAALLGASALVWITYMLFLHPRPDLSIMWLSSEYEFLADTRIKERLDSLPWDLNHDGRVKVAVQHVQFPEDSSNMKVRMQLGTLMAAGNFHIFLASDTAQVWLADNDLFGTWDNFAPDGARQEVIPERVRADLISGGEVFCISCEDLEFFRGDGLSSMKNLSLVITKPPTDEEGLLKYRREMEALRELLRWKPEEK